MKSQWKQHKWFKHFPYTRQCLGFGNVDKFRKALRKNESAHLRQVPPHLLQPTSGHLGRNWFTSSSLLFLIVSHYLFSIIKMCLADWNNATDWSIPSPMSKLPRVNITAEDWKVSLKLDLNQQTAGPAVICAS